MHIACGAGHHAIRIALPAVALLSVSAAGQDLGGALLADVPIDLPGHETAPRGKPAAPVDQPTDAAAAEPAVAAPDEAADREWLGHAPWWSWSRATGDWGGARTRLESWGLSLAGSYTLDWSSVWDGGVRRSASTLSVLDINATLDLAQAVGWQGATVFVDFYSTDGRGSGGNVGDFQGFSNAETDDNVDQIAELWFEQVLADGAVRLKLGKVEANAEFAFLDSAGEFINSSAGFTPTIVGFPSYPDPATAIVLQVSPWERVYGSVGLFDGATAVDGIRTGGRGPDTFFSDDRSDDWFIIGEVGVGWEAGSGRTGRIAGGVWRHTGEFETFGGELDDGTQGAYVVAEQRVWARDGEDAESDRGLYVFGQLGFADADVSEAEAHAGGGVSLLGTFEGRADDAAGVYVSWVDLSEPAGFSEDETAVEVFYRLQLTPWVSVKPDLQVIANPGGDRSLDTALVGTLRLEVVF